MDLIWAPYGIPTPEAEHRFHNTRRWRFDYCWRDRRTAVEIEGAVWSGGRHTRGAGFVKDMEKYNEAQRLGWTIYRFTPQQLKNGEAQGFMRAIFGLQ